MKATDITIILDRSGSMSTTKKDAIGGFNSFIETQKKVEGECTLTLVQFDNEYSIMYTAKPINEVEPLNDATYIPRGGTALIDAMGRTISEIEARMKKLKKEFRPNVIVVIITDGEENSSMEFNITNVNATITKLRKKGYEFVFIGANQDAIKAGQAFGIAGASSLTYAANSLGTTAVFDSMSANIASYRSGSKVDMSFEAKDFKAQADAGVK